MKSKSWPQTVRRKRKTRAWRSFPTLDLVEIRWVHDYLQQKSSSPRLSRSSSRLSPRPGPSRLCSQGSKTVECGSLRERVRRTRRRGKTKTERDSPQPGPSGLCTQGPKEGRSSDTDVLSTKRKDTPEKQQDSPSKRSRLSSSTGGPGGSSPSPRSTRWSNRDTSSTGPGSGGSEESISSAQARAAEEFTAKYEMGDKIHAGGFGQVFSGIRIEDSFPVAVKVIQTQNVTFTEVEEDGVKRSIPLEAHLINQVGAGSDSGSRTPLLLDWYDLGPEVILVLEKPEPCKNLLQYLQPNPHGLDEGRARVLFRQLVEAAIEMDSRGVFHRDIKPENILIKTDTDEHRAMFIDFGCGTNFTPGQEFLEPQGTPLYSSPEWFRSEPYTSGPTTVWQLGLVLYSMLFNRRPILHNERTIGSSQGVAIPPNVSPSCFNILRWCLEKQPERRPTLQNLRDHHWLNW